MCCGFGRIIEKKPSKTSNQEERESQNTSAENGHRLKNELRSLTEFLEVVQIWQEIKIGLTNSLFAGHIGLYPAIITSLKNDYTLTLPEHLTIFNMMLYLGTVLGVLISLLLNTSFKPRVLYLKTSAYLSLIGLILMRSSMSYWSIVIGRLISGIGMGIHSVTFHYYLYEYIFEHRYDLQISKLTSMGFSYRSRKNDFYYVTLIISVFGWFNQWQHTLELVILYNIFVLLFLHFIFDETPHSLLLMGDEKNAKQLFEKMAGGGDLTEIEPFFLNIKKEVKEALQMRDNELMLTYRSKMLSLSFIMNELSGISVYYCFMTSIINDWSLQLQFFFIFMVIVYEYMKRLAKPRTKEILLVKRLVISSNNMTVKSFLLGLLTVLQQYTGNFIIFSMMKIIILQCYFKSYGKGWIFKHRILFEDDEPYYMKMRRVPIALLGKFITIICLIYLYSESLWGLYFLTFGCCVFSFLNSLLIYFVLGYIRIP